MKIKKICKIVFITILSLASCNINLIPEENRIFVIEERVIDSSSSFFWFKGTGQITHESISYFQIANDKCDLSFEKANASCNEAVQIYEIKKDTVFLLTESEIKPINESSVKIKSIPFDLTLYDIDKRSNKSKQYFLDSLCNKN
jgi:hypothetical protein